MPDELSYPAAVNKEALLAGNQLDSFDHPLTLQWPGTRVQLFKNPTPLNRIALRFWLSKAPYNLAILLKGSDLMVVDVDSPDGMRFSQEHGLISNMVVRTRRGVHSYLRHDIALLTNRINYRGLGIDFLFNTAVPVPPSWRRDTGHHYTWLDGPVPKRELPLFDKRLLQEEVRRTIVPLVSKTRESLVKYIGHIVAESGSGGHGQAFRCACRIAAEVEDTREGLAIFLAWNETNARSPFSERECLHKIEDAYKKQRP
jgi:hypothetical protein